MKIVTIVGARPQFIKLGPLSKKLRTKHQEIIIHTGQHYDHDMSTSLFQDLGIPAPDYNLGVGSGSHGLQTGKMLQKIEAILMQDRPDLLIVFGDTNTTLAGGLAATKLNIPLLHIEAGLRSYNRHMPEEINRVAVDHIADFLFAPTQNAAENLTKEALADRCWLTGDIMVDAFHDNSKIACSTSTILDQLGLKENGYYLLTLHRPYNVDNSATLHHLFSELNKLDKPVVFPIHPRTRLSMEANNILPFSGCIPINPLGYLDFISLNIHALKILTDSGGVQKEAYLARKPCITLRTETEWTETIDEGWNILLPTDTKNIAEKITSFSPNHVTHNVFGFSVAQKMLDSIDTFNI